MFWFVNMQPAFEELKSKPSVNVSLKYPFYSDKRGAFEGKNRFIMVRKNSHNCTFQINYITLEKAELVASVWLVVLEFPPLKWPLLYGLCMKVFSHIMCCNHILFLGLLRMKNRLNGKVPETGRWIRPPERDSGSLHSYTFLAWRGPCLAAWHFRGCLVDFLKIVLI